MSIVLGREDSSNIVNVIESKLKQEMQNETKNKLKLIIDYSNSKSARFDNKKVNSETKDR